MIEKTGEYQIKVFRENGKLLMRLPNNGVISYDNRFGSLEETITIEGDYQIFPLEG
jgi:hypothetical protein